MGQKHTTDFTSGGRSPLSEHTYGVFLSTLERAGGEESQHAAQSLTGDAPALSTGWQHCTLDEALDETCAQYKEGWHHSEMVGRDYGQVKVLLAGTLTSDGWKAHAIIIDRNRKRKDFIGPKNFENEQHYKTYITQFMETADKLYGAAP